MVEPARKSGFSDVFVARPILAAVVSLLIIIAGTAALLGVDVREMPDVDQPVLSVSASYDGAAAETVDTEVTAVIEEALGALEGLLAISSRSSFGRSSITLEMSSGVDIDVAANEVREIVTQQSRQLPDDVEVTVSKRDSDADPIMRLALLGDTSLSELTEIAESSVADRLALVDGVAEVEVAGSQSNEYRVQVDMTALVGRGLTISDIANAVRTLRNATPLGDLDSATQTVTLRVASPDVTAADISALRIDDHTRVGDVAFVQLAARDRNIVSRVNGEAAVGLNILRQSVANTLSISLAVRDEVERIRPDLPPGVDLVIGSDDGVFIERSINEVVTSIGIAIAIVIAVIFVFIRSWRATLIPALTIPVALVGSIAAIWAVGFSVNTITLLALVLATGMVVDDAIVVVENIVRRRHEGLGARAAAALGTREVFFAVISTTATLAAVFVPISFLPGQAGGIFAEFGFVLAFAVTISSLVALTLVPMLAGLLDPGRGQPSGVEASSGLLARGYFWLVERALRAPLITIGLVTAFGILSWGAFTTLNAELTPTEDRGFFMIAARAPTGVSLDFTDGQVRQVEAILEPYLQSGEVASVQSLVGAGGSGGAFVIVRLADWAERDRPQQALQAELNQRFSNVAGLSVFARSPNSLGIRGAGNGVQFAIAGPDYQGLIDQAEAFVEAMAAETETSALPQLAQVAYQPEISVTVDNELAREMGLTVSEVSATVLAMTSGSDDTEVFLKGEEIPIVIEATGRPINDPSDLDRVLARTASGGFVPLSTVATFEQVAGLSSLSREAGERAVSVQANLASGVDLGTAVDRVRELGREMLTDGAEIVFLGEAATLEQGQFGTAAVFAVAFLIVFLVLAAQFESIASAVTIMLTVPFGLGAAVMAIAFTGGTMNYYSQIGLVMLIGIMAKNGILIVEFANQLREGGQSIDDAIRNAVRLRLRPVMMTMVSTVLGGLPLVLASGAGAEARSAVGWVVVGGLGIATVFTLFLTPVLYRLIAPLSATPGRDARRLTEELAEELAEGLAGETAGEPVPAGSGRAAIAGIL